MKTAKNCVKIFLAGLTAFLILTVLSAFYYRIPMHVPSTLGNTDFVWPAGASWIQMNEGISWGKFDDWGFNNPAVREHPDILVLGSSHMEATYVRQEQLLSVQLEELLEGRASSYNMGISGCHLPQTLQYLQKTLEAFPEPPGLILIEAHDLYLSPDQVSSILEGTVPSIFDPKPSWAEPILGLPYLRLMAKQKNLGLLKLLNPPRKAGPGEPFHLPDPPYAEDIPEAEGYDPLFSYLQSLQEQYGTKLLIFYQPTEELQKDGSVLFPQDPWIRVFAAKCRQYGLGFLDMTEPFEDLYSREHLLPHGFSTGRIGAGHLNAHGQRAIAEAVRDWITEKEGN